MSNDPTKPDDKGMHVSQKVWLAPESYNALRKELYEEWPTLWAEVQFYMAFDGPQFVSMMDEALDLVTQFDTDNVSGICARYLDSLRKLRGLSPLHTEAEYGVNKQMEKEVRTARDMNEIAPWKLPKENKQ